MGGNDRADVGPVHFADIEAGADFVLEILGVFRSAGMEYGDM